MNPSTPAMNFLGTKGEKVIVECAGHVYSVPLEDVQGLPLSDLRTQKSYYALEGVSLDENKQFKPASDVAYDSGAGPKQASSDSYSEMSGSDMESIYAAKNAAPMALASSSASQVLSKLKDEVTRLIDESILKIEQDWAEKSTVGRDEPAKETALPVEETLVHDSVETPKVLHPDGDRGQLGYREQNLQVLHSKLFTESKRQTRMKLLNEIHALVERLKDMETLE